MNMTLQIIPTPKTCEFTQGDGIRITKIATDFSITGPLKAAFDLLRQETVFSFSQEGADLRITADLSCLTKQELAITKNSFNNATLSELI